MYIRPTSQEARVANIVTSAEFFLRRLVFPITDSSCLKRTNFKNKNQSPFKEQSQFLRYCHEVVCFHS